MIVIGEKINATRDEVAAAISGRDAGAIAELAVQQVAAGADYIDVNAGLRSGPKECEDMAWLVAAVKEPRTIPVRPEG